MHILRRPLRACWLRGARIRGRPSRPVRVGPARLHERGGLRSQRVGFWRLPIRRRQVQPFRVSPPSRRSGPVPTRPPEYRFTRAVGAFGRGARGENHRRDAGHFRADGARRPGDGPFGHSGPPVRAVPPGGAGLPGGLVRLRPDPLERLRARPRLPLHLPTQ